MTLQVIAQAVAALLSALALRRGVQMPGLKPVPARRKPRRD
ncbi:hypothetical protein JOE48_001186 [Methylobacterium sp. PvR107]|nr:hypothetical protein [Methylobacterium sp. PvR107]